MGMQQVSRTRLFFTGTIYNYTICGVIWCTAPLEHTKYVPDFNCWNCTKYFDYLKQDVSNFNLPVHLDRQKFKFEFKHDKPKIWKIWQNLPWKITVTILIEMKTF